MEISLADAASLPTPCADPLTEKSYPVLFQGRRDAQATLDLDGASPIWFSTGNLLNEKDPCQEGAPGRRP